MLQSSLALKKRLEKSFKVGCITILLLLLAYVIIESNKGGRHGSRWYAGGHLSAATKAEWQNASDDERLATSNDFALKALLIRYGSFDSAMQHIGGTMENLYPYVVKVKDCINNGTHLLHDIDTVSLSGAACADRIINTEIKE